jgi:dTDP-4-dehydrorhamnose 3,5-epimerase
MKVTPTSLPGVILVKQDVFEDDRGYFFEAFRAETFAAAGLPTRFVQDNVSRSRRGVLRGLHLQHPRDQGKLVSVLAGAVFDVAVDVRRGSPTRAKWFGVELNDENRLQMYIPPGFAHGFMVTSESAVFAYKCTDRYDADAEITVRWDDPDIGITWPALDPTLSARDAGAPRLRAIPDERLPSVSGA